MGEAKQVVVTRAELLEELAEIEEDLDLLVALQRDEFLLRQRLDEIEFLLGGTDAENTG